MPALGRLRPLAVITSKRSPDLPNEPTVAESGFADFDAPAWWTILAPAKTPPDVLKRIKFLTLAFLSHTK